MIIRYSTIHLGTYREATNWPVTRGVRNLNLKTMLNAEKNPRLGGDLIDPQKT